MVVPAIRSASIAAVIALASYRSRSLDRSGAIGAFAVGTCTLAAGARTTATLLAFFVTSSILSRVGGVRKTEARADIEKGGPRNLKQVAANGGLATLCALGALVSRDADAQRRWRAAFAGAYAAATADTWATEIGTLSRGNPRSILTGKPLAPGLSGGVTRAGTLASLAGAAWIAIFTSAFSRERSLRRFWATVTAGFAGALIDSLLGATLQDLRYCPTCERACEMNPHGCGARTTTIRGRSWMTNDIVNVSASAAGAALGALLV